MRAMMRDPEGKVLLGAALSTLVVGTVVYMQLEGWSVVDALYFSVVTLATVGFGDLHPTTDLAKLFTVGYILVGVGIIATFVVEIGKYRGDGPIRRIEGRLHRRGAGPVGAATEAGQADESREA